MIEDEDDNYRSVAESYRERGYLGTVGFGERPAVVVVDWMIAFTDPECPLGSDYSAELAASKDLLDAARSRGVPVIFTSTVYHANNVDAGMWVRKAKALGQYLVENTKWEHIDPRLEPREEEIRIIKKYASSFFATHLQSTLQGLKVDTVIITGCTTSGCVRATAVDSISHGYHTIVPLEAVGDRAKEVHDASIFDMNAKYADVLPTAEVIAYLEGFPAS